MMQDVLDRAILFATQAHQGQKRKDGAPFILHPLEDAAVVATLTHDPEILAAAVLHDTVEDTDVTIEQIQEQFGERIADLVAHETENKRPEMPADQSWKIRKVESLDMLEASTDPAVRMLWMGDKLSNLRGLYRQVSKHGENAFIVFNNADPKAQRWYFERILRLLAPLKDTPAYKEYEDLFHRVFDTVPEQA